jgi:hypothetical protein
MSVAKLRALFADTRDRPDAELSVEFKQRLLKILAEDHARTLSFISSLEDEIAEATEMGEFDLSRKKQIVLVSITLLETELRALLDEVVEEVQAATPAAAGPVKVSSLWTCVEEGRRRG